VIRADEVYLPDRVGLRGPQHVGRGRRGAQIEGRPAGRQHDASAGAGSPIATTTDGRSNPIGWIVGAEGDGRLRGYRGDSGEPLLTGGGPGEAMSGLRHFQTLLAAGNRLYVGADDRAYAFSF
jgi:hypothetical protein